jgi:YD repeat-containing protein
MIRNKKAKKRTAVVLIVTLFINTFLPAISRAMTSGPTAPEATSFEPVDTSNMVSMQNGELAYSIPLLEVPGPEGNYPLSLSYHNNILPNSDASWVGLGWTLNPGAITRSVNGYPDDWDGILNTRRDYWDGQTTRTYGIDFGIGGPGANVSIGLSYSSDNYRGTGIGFDVGASQGLSAQSPLRTSANIGTDGYGNASIGMGISDPFTHRGLDVSTDFESVSFGITPGVISGLGINMSSKGDIGFKLGGIGGNIYNHKAGNLKTNSHGFQITIPIYQFFVGLKYQYTRTYSDETINVSTYGSLYTNDGVPGGNFDNAAFDSYSLLDDPYHPLASNPDPSFELGGSFPDVDNYTVTAQGLGGTFTPRYYEGYLLSQNRKNASAYLVKYGLLTNSTSPNYAMSFRFNNDFSNKYIQNNALDFNYSNFVAPFDASPSYGDGTGQGFNIAGNKLAGSRNINYFLNQNIVNGAAKSSGFIDNSAACPGFVRPNDKQVGGFSITNESGVTYHYALPAYSSNEITYSEKIGGTQGTSTDGSSDLWNKLTRPGAYAYTWYLTSVTGPDFVDVNGNGIADAGDWGYWVNFEYGKWTDAYLWRNPSEGFQRDLDNVWQTYSKGQKDVYYLNAIKTRTHTALFIKDIRSDGKGESASISGNNTSLFDGTSKSPMKLNSIYLLNSADAATISPATSSIYSGHYGNNVIDVNDVTPALITKAIRIINFSYDYSLTPNTTNSFDYSALSTLLGKLSLNQIAFLGKGGDNSIPAMTFNYELPSDVQQTVAITTTGISDNTNRIGSITLPGSSTIGEGDILTWLVSGSTTPYYALVTQRASGATSATVKYLTSNFGPGIVNVTAVTTKNPPYDKDAYDLWGTYKPDYTLSAIKQNPNLGRHTSAVSAKANDAWTLRSIKGSIGSVIKMDYEPNCYYTSVLNGNSSLLTSNFNINTTNNTMSFNINTLGYRVSDWFQVGDMVSLLYYRINTYTAALNPPAGLNCSSQTTPPPPYNEYGQYGTRAVPVATVIGVDNVNSLLTISYNAGILPYGRVQQSGSCFDILYSQPLVGNLYTFNNRLTYGSGARVKSVKLVDGIDNRTFVTNYSYNNIDNNLPTSGVTPYEPVVLDVPAQNDNFYKRYLYQGISHMLTIARELPPPGVIYKYVTVQSEVDNLNDKARIIEGKTVYNFEVFSSNMIDLLELSRTSGTVGATTYSTRNITIKDFTSRLGALKKIIKYDNNNQILSQVITNYLDDGLETLPDVASFSAAFEPKLAGYNNQGVIKERFSMAKSYSSAPPNVAIMSAKETFPNVVTGETTIDNKTGVTSTSQILTYDFFGGQATQTLDIDGYGNRILNVSVPAYTKYSGLGLSTTSPSYKNMLSQEAANYQYKVDGSNNKLGLIGAKVSTWTDAVNVLAPDNTINTEKPGGFTLTVDVFRNQFTYQWLPSGQSSDGMTPIGSFVDYNWNNPTVLDPGWKKASEITLYNAFSNALESRDINGIYSTNKTGYNSSRIVVGGSPAKYTEIAFSGAEDNPVAGVFGGSVSIGSGTIVSSSSFPTSSAHTGYNSLKLSAGQTGFTYSADISTKLVAGRDYLTSVWVKNSNDAVNPLGNIYYQINAQTPVTATISGKKSNGWYLINLIIPGTVTAGGGTLSVGCTNAGSLDLYFDDFRFQPLNANVSSFVYDTFSGELTYVLNNHNLFTRYEYDAEGRLARTYRETLTGGVFKTKEYLYNYGH